MNILHTHEIANSEVASSEGGYRKVANSHSPLALHHGFYEVEYLAENDRARYTISPDARKEVLKRLLALNHERAAQEATKAVPSAKNTKRKQKPQDASLFDDDAREP